MRLRPNSCLLLLSVSSTAPLAASLTSKAWGSSTAASSPGRSPSAGGARYLVPRRDEASCRAAAEAETSIDASAFASSGRNKYGESQRALALPNSVHAPRRLDYLNTATRRRLARRRRAVSTRTPTSLCANTGSAGTDTEVRSEKTKNQCRSDKKSFKQHDDTTTVGHLKESEDETAQDDVGKNKMKFRTFEEMLEQHRETPILVSFEAKWCGPCKLMKKELKIVRDELAESVMVARVDTEKFPSLGARYEVEGLPSVILFVDGEPIHRIEGLEEAAEILRQVRGFLR